MRSTPPSKGHPTGQSTEKEDALHSSELALAKQAYANAIEKNVGKDWFLFHWTGGILFTTSATTESDLIRQGQAALRSPEVISGHYPRFSHVLLCVMPGLFIESTPVSWDSADHDKPAVQFILAEQFDKTERSDFLVMRSRDLRGKPDVLGALQNRCIFHHSKPYNFYHHRYFKDSEYLRDRVLCSQLVALIYGEVGVRSVPDREYDDVLPFDLELPLENSEDWLDVTSAYIFAEELLDRHLIGVIPETSKINFRAKFMKRFEAVSDISSKLTAWGNAAKIVNDEYRKQMSRPFDHTVGEQKLTYASNLQRVLAMLRRDYRQYHCRPAILKDA